MRYDERGRRIPADEDPEFARLRTDAVKQTEAQMNPSATDTHVQDVRNEVARLSQPSKTLQPDFPSGWSASFTSGSGRVTRLSYEPEQPIQLEDARDAVSAFMGALGGV